MTERSYHGATSRSLETMMVCYLQIFPFRQVALLCFAHKLERSYQEEVHLQPTVITSIPCLKTIDNALL